MKYHFKIHKEKKGCWAECVELEGCHTQAETMEKLKKNMEEALNLYLDEPADSIVVFPLPRQVMKGKDIAAIPVDPRIAFSVFLRQARLQQNLTQKEVANLLGVKNIYSYQRLESSDTANPTLVTIAKIKKVFPAFDVNELLSA